jgi:hypothetical protein
MNQNLLVLFLVGSMMGCTQSLRLETSSDVPAPLVGKLPLSIGVYYDDRFKTYAYEENSEDRPNWRISSGAAEVQLFDRILFSMFETTRPVSGTSVLEGSGLDAIISPHIEEMQFALPYETRTELYEVWIKYTITLYQPDGELISEFPLTGYGKSSTEFLKSRDAGIQTAIGVAYRDAGAKLALGFPGVLDVREWLVQIPRVCNSEEVDLC